MTECLAVIGVVGTHCLRSRHSHHRRQVRCDAGYWLCIVLVRGSHHVTMLRLHADTIDSPLLGVSHCSLN
jgi:hypothetical protein